MPKWDGKVPYDAKTGSVRHYAPDLSQSKANEVFTDTLRNFRFHRGRSAAHAEAESTQHQGRVYTVFLTDLEDMLPVMKNGTVSGEFTYCKRGMNYGTKLVGVAA